LNSQNQIFETLTTLLERHNILASAAEVQGMFCGMLGGGMPLECLDWHEPIADFIHQGEKLPGEVQTELEQLYNFTCQQLVDSDFALVLCMPDDSAPINDRGQALLSWVQGFMLGFGLHQADLTGCSADVKEGLEDFAEIARMDEEMSEDEESERALFEVLEYVRVTAMLCFNELGKSPEEQQSQPKTVH
jgi:yecA family protein